MYSEAFKDKEKPHFIAYMNILLHLDHKYEILHSMNFDKNWDPLYDYSGAYFSIIRSSLQDSIVMGIINLIEDETRSSSNLEKYFKNLKKT